MPLCERSDWNLSPEKQARVREILARRPHILAEIEANRPELDAAARVVLAEQMVRIEERRGLLAGLREAREAQGLSLADVEKRAGFGLAQLSRLETDFTANPTLDTLQRYAEALGMKLVIQLVPADEPAHAK